MATSSGRKHLFTIIAISAQQGTGKTALIRRFCTDECQRFYRGTSEIHEKYLTVNGTPLKLQIFDLDILLLKYKTVMWDTYSRGSDGVIITYDVTDRQSYLKLKDMFMLNVIKQFAKHDKILVGLKCDIESNRKVQFGEAIDFAVEHNMKCYEASAMTGFHVKEVFDIIISDILKRKPPEIKEDTDKNVVFRRTRSSPAFDLAERIQGKRLRGQKRTLPAKYKVKPTEDVMGELKNLGLDTSSDFNDLLRYGAYRCFWCRIFLVGQFSVGKSSLAKVLVGEPLPDMTESTDGIWIYMGRAGISIKDKKWIYLPQGLGRLELEQCPLNRHIRRLAAEIPPYKCREIIVHLGVSVNTWENLEYQFSHQNPDDLKFMALYLWKEANQSASFSDLSNALTNCDISSHLLCQVLRDIDLPEDMDREKLAKTPTSKLLTYISNHIGDSSLQLGIELALDVSELENIRYRYKDKLLDQTREILRKWNRNSPQASTENLIKAVTRIGKAGCLKGLQL